MLRPCAASALARASTSNAVSVPSDATALFGTTMINLRWQWNLTFHRIHMIRRLCQIPTSPATRRSTESSAQTSRKSPPRPQESPKLPLPSPLALALAPPLAPRHPPPTSPLPPSRSPLPSPLPRPRPTPLPASVIPAPPPSFLLRQESMRPPNRATSLHPPDGSPAPPAHRARSGAVEHWE